MKDKNGINIDCQNCEAFEYCKDSSAYEQCQNKAFSPSKEAYESRIKELQDELYADKYNYESWEEIKEEHQKLEATIVELQKELNIVQESERAEAQEADRLRGEIKELEKKLTETVKLLGERSRECGKLQALLEVKNRSDISTQSTDAVDVSKNGEKSTESEQSHLEDFTIEEIDFTKKAISMAIFDCETNPPKPSDENLKLMWSIKSKCDAILKANVRENRTLKESDEK